MPLGHLDELARVAAAATPEVAAVLRTPQAQEQVVGMARVASRPDFARALARWVAAQDPGALEAEHEAQRRERFFSMSAQPGGVFLKGRLDRVAGESLRVALDAMGQYGDETRSPGQASADALTMLAEARVRRGAAPAAGPGGAREWRARVWHRRRGESPARVPAGGGRDRRRAAGSPTSAGAAADAADDHATVLGAPRRRRRDVRIPGTGVAPADRLCAPIALPWGTVAPATLEDGTPVAMSELARVLCEADITRIVMSAESLPAGCGTDQAVVHHRATAGRDGPGRAVRVERVRAARVPLRGAPHPLVGPRQGDTSISNAALLCKHHHSEVHRLNLTLHRLEKPPGWTRRQRAKAELRGVTRVRAVRRDPGIDAPTTGRAPLRYVFRNHRGHTINAPDGHPPDH